jgi:hypothetical protein
MADMSTVIFVHGTGVREPVFSMLFGRVRSELRRRRPELGIEPCYWGGAEGARLWHHGHSVPAYDATRGVVPGPEDEELALWSLLYQDRLWELRMLAMTGPAGGDLPPGRQPGDVLDASMRSLDPSGELAAALSAAGLAETFESARAAVAASPVYRQALAEASGSIGALRLAAARAIVAEALAEQAERDDADIPVVPDAACGVSKPGHLL